MFDKEILEIKEYIKDSSNIFVVGHKNIDLDAFGGCLGICCYASMFNKKAFIILDDKRFESSVKKAINLFEEKMNYVNSSSIHKYIDEKSLLVIVDTNKINLLNSKKILKYFKNIIIIDHHNVGNNTIQMDNVKLYNHTDSSSVCELLSNMLEVDNYSLDDETATILLSGIVLDTNNFVLKTTFNTYKASYYLTKMGASNKKVQYLLKQDLKEYIEMQKIITDAKIINNIALSKGLQRKKYRREDLARVADTLLLFNNIEASFVVGKTNKGIGISARSMGDINVGAILEMLGGGGNSTEAATVIENNSLNEVVDIVKKIIKKI